MIIKNVDPEEEMFKGMVPDDFADGVDEIPTSSEGEHVHKPWETEGYGNFHDHNVPSDEGTVGPYDDEED